MSKSKELRLKFRVKVLSAEKRTKVWMLPLTFVMLLRTYTQSVRSRSYLVRVRCCISEHKRNAAKSAPAEAAREYSSKCTQTINKPLEGTAVLQKKGLTNPLEGT